MNFDSLKSMRAAQNERHAPHKNANGKAGTMARLAPINDQIIDWFISEIMRAPSNPIEIIETYNDMAAACLSMMTRSTATTLGNIGQKTIKIPQIGMELPVRDGITTFAINDFLGSFQDFDNRETDMVRTSGQQALKDIGG